VAPADRAVVPIRRRVAARARAEYLRRMNGGLVNRPLVLIGVIVYSVLVAALRCFGVIGTTGTVVLFAIMIADLAATHWLLRRRPFDKP